MTCAGGQRPAFGDRRPGFADPERFDFRFRNTKIVRKIGFKPFDYDKAGVYGSEEWKGLARTDPDMARRFDAVVQRAESAGSQAY